MTPLRSSTRAHFLHSFYPHKLAYASCDGEGPGPNAPQPPAHARQPKMQSQQAPRRERLAAEAAAREAFALLVAPPKPAEAPAGASPTRKPVPVVPTVVRRAPISDPTVTALDIPTSSLFPSLAPSSTSPSTSSLPPLVVQCQVRTRIPTPHGHVFLHLYKNNHDVRPLPPLSV